MILLYFIVGLVLASFINASAYRLRKGLELKDFVIRPSHCEKCKRDLRWFDLIPVLSYLIFKGRCSQCKAPVYWYYPISELVLGISFASLYYGSFTWEYYVTLPIIFFLSYWDVKDKSIPKQVTDALLVFSLIIAVISVISEFSSSNIFRVLIPVVLLGVWGIINWGKEKMGWGDLIIFMSLILAHGVAFGLSVLFFTILAGGVWGIILVVKDRENRKKYIPLVPFILIGFVLAINTVEHIKTYLFLPNL
ncbi:MAG TPA: prepilin peptidase [Candidatus Dojkabacteria bacterium]|nr:prepilin peptidase [Candidatus Dojkabacteria bacterium]